MKVELKTALESEKERNPYFEMTTLHKRFAFFHFLSFELLHSIIRIHSVVLILSKRHSDVSEGQNE